MKSHICWDDLSPRYWFAFCHWHKGETQKAISKDFGVSPSRIYHMCLTVKMKIQHDLHQDCICFKDGVKPNKQIIKQEDIDSYKSQIPIEKIISTIVERLL